MASALVVLSIVLSFLWGFATSQKISSGSAVANIPKYAPPSSSSQSLIEGLVGRSRTVTCIVTSRDNHTAGVIAILHSFVVASGAVIAALPFLRGQRRLSTSCFTQVWDRFSQSSSLGALRRSYVLLTTAGYCLRTSVIQWLLPASIVGRVPGYMS